MKLIKQGQKDKLPQGILRYKKEGRCSPLLDKG